MSEKVEKLAVTINEASEAIGIGKTKLYQLIAQGKIPVVKVGKRTLIPVEGLKAFIASLQEAA